jgi:hypothetical protein
LVDRAFGVVEPGNACHNLSNLGIIKRRPASHAIPSQQQFKGHVGVDAVPQQMPSQRSNR